MHWKNGMAQGFALFSHGAAAGQAIQTINGLVFDDGVVSSLYCLDTDALQWAIQDGYHLPQCCAKIIAMSWRKPALGLMQLCRPLRGRRFKRTP